MCRVRTDRVWTRDYGPMFVKGLAGELAITDWQFNAWAKYPIWTRDNDFLGCGLPTWTTETLLAYLQAMDGVT